MAWLKSLQLGAADALLPGGQGPPLEELPLP